MASSTRGSPKAMQRGSPLSIQPLGLAESVEDFAVEQLVAQASVEALDVAVLPGATSLDVGGLGADNRDPFLYCLGMHDPSASQSLPRLGCLWGTFSPSRCQIRSTHLSLIVQPTLAQQRGHLAIAIAAVLPGKLDNIGGETPLVGKRCFQAAALSAAGT